MKKTVTLTTTNVPTTSTSNITNNNSMVKETTSPLPSKTVPTSRRFCGWELAPWRALVTVGSCMVMEATLGVTYTNGNVMPYLTSYLRNVTGETSLDYSDMLWLGNSTWLVVSIILPLLGLIVKKVPRRLYILTGVLVNAVAFFGTYWAVQTSYIMLILVYGVLQGVAQSILWPVCVILALEWFPHRKGLASGVTMAGYGGGAFIWNQVITQWVNPHNLKPDLAEGGNLYFTQEEVLGRLPSCFLLLGGILISVQLICVFAMVFHQAAGDNDKNNDDDHGDNNNDDDDDDVGDGDVARRDSPPAADGERGQMTQMMKMENINGDSVSHDGLPKNRKAIPPEEAGRPTPECTPLEILTSRATWTLFLSNLYRDYAFIFIVVFYKAYGQTFIHNDHLLALVASFAAVFNAAGRPLWGLVTDRIGFLPALLLTQGILVVTSATFLTCELTGSSAMFFVWVCAIFASFSGIFTIESPMVFTLFGPRHFLFGLGVISGTSIISTLTSAPLAKVVLTTLSWKGLFLLGSACVALSMLTLASLLVSCGHPIPQHMRTGLLAPRRHQAKA